MLGFGQQGLMEKERLELVTVINWCSKWIVHIFSLGNHCFFLLQVVAFCIMLCLQLNEVPGFSSRFDMYCSCELNPLVTLGSSVLCLSHFATRQDF